MRSPKAVVKSKTCIKGMGHHKSRVCRKVCPIPGVLLLHTQKDMQVPISHLGKMVGKLLDSADLPGQTSG